MKLFWFCALALTLVGCSMPMDASPLDTRACVPHRGTYEEVLTQRDGGTCGELAPTVRAYNTINLIPFGCRGGGVLSGDGCEMHRKWVCDENDEDVMHVTTLDMAMSSDWSRGEGVYHRLYLGVCASTYDVKVTRLD